jgi:hypothetical protein
MHITATVFTPFKKCTYYAHYIFKALNACKSFGFIALERFRKWCRPKFHWYPTLSAEKSGKDGARKSTVKAKML